MKSREEERMRQQREGQGTSVREREIESCEGVYM